jgi:hypothetical protein
LILSSAKVTSNEIIENPKRNINIESLESRRVLLYKLISIAIKESKTYLEKNLSIEKDIKMQRRFLDSFSKN